MAQVPCYYKTKGSSIPYVWVAGTDVVGNVKLLGSIPMIWESIDPYDVIGQLSPDGVWDVPKDTSTFTPGDAVYWNPTGNPVNGTAGTGAATSNTSGTYLMGVCVPPTTGVSAIDLTTDSFVPTLLTAAMRTTTIGGAVTADSITGDTSSFAIGALGAAQGGAIVVTGGTSSTSGNAGGAISLVGGTPGATGIGGAVSMTGAIGGATSGAGGAVTMTGGAGTNGNAAGGAATQTGGAGQGSAAGGASAVIGGAGGATGAGGAITITSGAGGSSSGAAGAINIAVGSATSGNGAAVTITSGAGAGGTNAGGMINLVPGAAVSTGIPGQLQVNGDANLIMVNESLSATDATRAVFIANRPMILKSVKEVHSTASSSGTLQIEKLTGTTAAGSGTNLLTGTISLAGTANTVLSGTLIATIASLTFAAGDRLGVVIAGTMTSLANCKVQCGLAPL